jgi:CHAT domain-containing protein
MTLWKVDDQVTRDAMIEYYRRLLAGVSIGEALRAVQLKMLASRAQNHPYFWAGFIPLGDWTTVITKPTAVERH